MKNDTTQPRELAGEQVKEIAAAIERDVCELDYTGQFDEEAMLAISVNDLRRICIRHIAALTWQAAPEAPTLIYQVQFHIEQGSSAWHDASEAAYHTVMPERRRIVYASTGAAPEAPATTASASGERCACGSHSAEFCASAGLCGPGFKMGWGPVGYGRAPAPSRDATLESAAQAVAERVGDKDTVSVASVYEAIRALKKNRQALPESCGAAQAAHAGAVGEAAIRAIVTKAREFYLGYLSRHIPSEDIDAVRSAITTDTATRAIAFDLRAAMSAATKAKEQK